MHKELSAIAIFVAVAEEGGFSKAADRLGLTNSVISHHVAKLEEKLGVTLLYRSTRQVTLSDQGRAFYNATAGALVSIEEAVVDLTSSGEDPVGTLNIAMPAFMPDPRLQQLIWDFAKEHHNVAFDISYSDDRQDLISGGYDVAFRLGMLESSGMMARKMSDIELQLVASPKLLSTMGKITRPEHVANAVYISIKQLNGKIHFSKGDVSKEIELGKKRIEVDNIYAARDATIAGLGLFTLPEGMCAQAIADGKLQQILPKWHLSTIPLYAVWNNKARRNSLTRRLLTYLAEN